MSWLLFLVFLSFTFSNEFVTEASKVQNMVGKLPSAVVVGTVYCDTCFHQDSSKSSHFIAGAIVAIECKDNASSTTPAFRQEVKTNKHGEFQVHLPFSVSKHVRKIKSCSVELIRSNEPFCAVAAAAKSTSLNLKSRKHGTHIFSAGFFTFKPLEQPEVCNQKSITPEKSSRISNPDDPSFPPPLQDPPASNPPLLGGVLPLLPPVIPQLPTILPGIPLLPPKNKKQHSEFKDSKQVNQPTDFPLPPNPFNPLPPIPLLPPPSLPIPNPLQPPPSVLPPVLPTPPPSIFPPVFPTPPPTIFPPILPTPSPSPPPFSLPPLIPGLVPSPSPPPPAPTLLPPFPFQPIPGFPGVPPAKASPASKTSSP